MWMSRRITNKGDDDDGREEGSGCVIDGPKTMGEERRSKPLQLSSTTIHQTLIKFD
jgi:hypothetical protein